jgi:hypothetical protein
MKSLFIYAQTVVLASLVLYGGAGLNVFRYCCDGCRLSGMTSMTGMAIAHSCCDNHSVTYDCEEHSFATNSCGEHEGLTPVDNCGHNSGSESCCSFERITFDWDMQSASKLLPDNAVSFSCLFFSSSFLFGARLSYSSEAVAVLPNGPPLPCPRDYLALLTVLLI